MATVTNSFVDLLSHIKGINDQAICTILSKQEFADTWLPLACFNGTCYVYEMNVMIRVFCLFMHIGKVHGSLARAGKVRGQTPKVHD